jgi:hypothetical protein
MAVPKQNGMKNFPGYLKVFVLVFISVVILYYLELMFHGRLHHLIAGKLLPMSPHWYFYESLFFTFFDFLFAFLGFLLFRNYKRSKKHDEDLLFIFSIPALYPVFLIASGILGGLFFKPCFIPEYSAGEHVIVWAGRIFLWAYASFFSIYVLLNLSRKYTFIFLLEFFVFLAYLAAFYAKLIGPVRLPFHIF